MGVLSLLLAAATGIVWMLPLRHLLPGPAWGAWWLLASAGALAGFSAVSLCQFLLLLLGLATPLAQWMLDLLLLVGGAIFAWRAKGKSPAGTPGSRFPYNWALALAAGITFLLIYPVTWDSFQSLPHGDWDAWSQWNMRAKMLAAGGEAWKNAYSPLMFRNHPDYPMMLSGLVAHGWRAAGSIGTEIPAVTGLAIFLCLPGLLIGALAVLRSVSLGWLVWLAFAAAGGYLVQPPAQYSDVLLSLFELAALAFTALALRQAAPSVGVAAGFLASSVAWTKNEGLPFVLALLLIAALLRRDLALPIWSGAAPGLLAVTGFKLFLAPPSGLMGNQTAADYFAKLTDPARYAKVAAAMITDAGGLGFGWKNPLLLLAILSFVLRFAPALDLRPARIAAAAALGFQLAFYFAFYLVQPEDLAWQLGTTLNRLMAHLWPSVFFLGGLWLRAPEELFPALPATTPLPSRAKAAPKRR